MSASFSKITLATLAMSLLATGPAAAEPMTLAKCIDVALHGNPDIASANLEVEATTAQSKSARGAFGPRLHLDAGIQRWGSPLTASFSDMLIPVVNVGLGKNGLTNQVDKSDFAGPLAPLAQPIELRAQTTWSASATLAQPIASLWTINEGYALRKLGVDLAGLQRKVARRDVAFQVTEAYYRVLQAMRMADVAQKSVENIDAQVRRAQSFFRAGTVGRNDVLRAELGLAAARQRLIQANGSVVLARGRLATLMGLAPDAAIEPVDSIAEVTVAPAMSATQAEDRAVADRLEMKEIAAQTELARAGERLAKSKMLPQVNAVANFTHSSPATMFAPKQNIWFIGGSASWDIWEGGGTYYGIDESKARMAQALSARRKAEDGIRLETRSAHVNATTADQALHVVRDAVEQAEENFRIEQKRYESGDNTSFDVLDAENQLTTARGQLQAATYDSLIAQSNLARAMGQQTPGNTP
ncbi:MAG TPA: TolC family protein [Polyangia bacterium]|jgi:Outer membrane protein|nr:TolC family protein [Polyangia bacterium]